MNGLPVDVALVDALRQLEVVERCDPAQLAEVTIPLATSMARAPSSWAGERSGSTRRTASPAATRTSRSPCSTPASTPTHPRVRRPARPGFDFVDIIDGADAFLGDRLDADADPTDPGVGHGSHVAGILVAAGRADADRRRARAAACCPCACSGALRQGDRLIGAGLVDNINAGIKWAVDHGADVINMSLGIRHEGGGLPHVDVDPVRRSARVSTVVAAAGNDGARHALLPGRAARA